MKATNSDEELVPIITSVAESNVSLPRFFDAVKNNRII
jgi:hypothetical protein